MTDFFTARLEPAVGVTVLESQRDRREQKQEPKRRPSKPAPRANQAESTGEAGEPRHQFDSMA